MAISWKHIGFLGTSDTLTAAQFRTLHSLLYDHWDEIYTLHHGDAIGADAEFDGLARALMQQNHYSPTVVTQEPTRPRRETAAYAKPATATYQPDAIDMASAPVIFIHPATEQTNRAHCEKHKVGITLNDGAYTDYDTEVLPSKPLRERNKHIIAMTTLLIVCPPTADLQAKLDVWRPTLDALGLKQLDRRPSNIIVIPPIETTHYYTFKPDTPTTIKWLQRPWVPVRQATVSCFLCRDHIASTTASDTNHVWMHFKDLIMDRRTIFYCSKCKFIHDFSSTEISPYNSGKNHPWVSLRALNASART